MLQATVSRNLQFLRIPLFPILSMITSALVGCGSSVRVPSEAAGHPSIVGLVHGGQQPVSGSRIYLYAASGSGIGGASSSLLTGPGYVVSDPSGNFSITGDYSCPVGAQVYLLALGGNPGLAGNANNGALALASGLGACSQLSSSTSVTINEVTTVATAYALAGFATTENQIGASTALATGLGNAFGNIQNLANNGNGLAVLTTPAGNGTAPQRSVNALANSLAACVNSTGTGTACSALMAAANVTGAGGTPVDTFQAILNIARDPGVNVAKIFQLAAATAVFQPTLSTAPSDWTLTVQYAGNQNPALAGKGNNCSGAVTLPSAPITDICQTQGIAIDAQGNVWISNFLTANLAEFSPAGAELSPGGGFSTPSMYKPQELGIDNSGNVWVTSIAATNNGTSYADSVQKFSPSGTALSGATGFTGGGLKTPRSLAIDAYGNVWAGGIGELSEFTSAGVAVSGTTGFQVASLLAVPNKMNFDRLGNDWISSYDGTNGNAFLTEFTPLSHAQNLNGQYGGTATQNIALASGSVPQGVAVDYSNRVWVADLFTKYGSGNGSLVEYSNAGALLSPANGYTSGGVINPNDAAIDGAGNVFSSQSQIGEISSSGAAVSPTNGYQNPNPNDCCLVSAIDSAGSLWLTGGSYLYQMIGLATPVITPMVSNLSVSAGVALTPASATMAQTGQQALTASVVGANPGSFSFTTSASAGLLNEVGGAGQQSQTSYCSVSAVTLYVPNATPTLTANAADTVTVKAYTGTGCVAANLIGTSAAATITIEPPGSAVPTVVTLSPTSSIISQGLQQVFGAILSGSPALSYRWTTSGNAGLLNEVGGTGQTNQLSYCSSSNQTTYASNLLPALTANTVDTVTVQTFSAAGCVGTATGTSTPASVTITAPSAAAAIIPGFPTTMQLSTVVLPPGLALTPNQVTVVDSVGQTKPGSSGTFEIPSYSFGSQIAVVELPDGNPLLLGWMDRTHNQITTGTTAEVLAYYAFGGDLMFTESDRNALEAAILAAPGLPALTQVITNELSANPDALAQLDTNIQTALNTFFTSVSGIVPQKVKQSGLRPYGILVNPGVQSGENVEQLPPSMADVTNLYRRRSHAFVTRVSDTPNGTPAPPDVSDPLAVTDFEVSPSVGLTGGVAGTISDIYNYYWGNTTAAYAPTTSDPFSIPLTPGFAKTTYQVTIVGPGSGNAALLQSLPQAQQTVAAQVSVGGFVTDALIPFCSNFLFGSGFPPSSETVPVEAFQATWKMDLQNDFLNALSTAPAIQTAIQQGDYAGALASVTDSIRQGQVFRDVLITSVQQAAGKNWVSSSATEALQLVNTVLNAAGGALQIFDSSVYVTQLAKSDAADQWTVVVTNQKVTLSPAQTTLAQFGPGVQTLTAAVPGVDTTGYSYFWTNTGKAGDIVPISGNAGAVSNSGFCSSSASVLYTDRPSPVLTVAATDTITVQAFSSGNCVTANQVGLTQTAVVTITPDTIAINPNASSITQSGQAPLAAVVPGATGTGYSYLWTLAGTGGAATVGTLTEVGGTNRTAQTSFCSTSSQATYVPNATPTLLQNATDAVKVQAFSAAGCPQASSLGTSAPATVTVSVAALLLTPVNQSINQNQDQTLLVQVSGLGATGLYYQWSTSAGAGTLSGGGQLNQVQYCSTSTTSVYVPNATPSLINPVTDTVAVQAFNSPICAAGKAVSKMVSTTITVTVPWQTAATATPVILNSIMQASNGNFYSTFNGSNFCAAYPQYGNYYSCGSIYAYSPTSPPTDIYDFSESGAVGGDLANLVEGASGSLYGANLFGGDESLGVSACDGLGCGAFYSLDSKNNATNLHNFSANESSQGGPIIQGSDGNFYGTHNWDGFGGVWKVTPGGTFTNLQTFRAFGQTQDLGLPSGLIEASDGNFYTTVPSDNTIYYLANGQRGPCGGCWDGVVYQVTPTGQTTAIATLPTTGTLGINPVGPLVEGPDGALYGVTTGDNYDLNAAPPTVFRVTLSGQMTTLYTFLSNVSLPYPLVLGADGKLYGIAYTGYSGCNGGCGSLFSLNIDGSGFQTLYVFPGGNGGAYPNSLGWSSSGALWGTAGSDGAVGSPVGVVFNAVPPTGAIPPIQMSFTDQSSGAAITSSSLVLPNTPVVLTWNVLNAYSNTARQCYAYVPGGTPAAAGVWTGLQAGTVNSSGYGGRTVLTPTAVGTYEYELTCGGVESQSVSLTVRSGP